jgi:rRNA pseudouridine-1189 N-methylase Emg1 (Nep1/Mra1 family)
LKNNNFKRFNFKAKYYLYLKFIILTLFSHFYQNYASKLTKNGPICLVVGGVAKTDPCMEIDYTDETICISKYALSASCCLSRMV